MQITVTFESIWGKKSFQNETKLKRITKKGLSPKTVCNILLDIAEDLVTKM